MAREGELSLIVRDPGIGLGMSSHHEHSMLIGTGLNPLHLAGYHAWVGRLRITP